MYGYVYSYSYGKIGGAVDLSLYKFSLWNPITNVDGTREIVNEGSANNLTLYSGSGTSFNGTNQSLDGFTLPLDATHMIYLKDNVKVYTTTLIDFSTIVPSGTYKDVYCFNRALTTTEQDKYTSQPEQFYIDALTDDTCVLNMPLNDKGSTAHDYVSNTDYPKLNYTTDQNISNLQYGTQDLKLPHDDLGLRDGTITPWIKGDGVSYADTGWIPPSDSDWSIELVSFVPDVADYEETEGVASGGGLDASKIRFYIGSGGKPHCWVGEQYSAIAGVSNEYLHWLFSYDSVNNTYTIYWNGATTLSSFKTGVNLLQSNESFKVNSYNSGVSNRGTNEIRLFKVHDKALTQEEVTTAFQDAQAKGLLA